MVLSRLQFSTFFFLCVKISLSGKNPIIFAILLAALTKAVRSEPYRRWQGQDS
jgi:hypothetical protein